MAENQFIEVLRPVIAAWVHRNERAAARDAGLLIFWRDGMLKQIEDIAEGRMTTETLGELKKGLEESADGVDEAMKRLKYARSKLAGTKLGDQIDKILNNMSYGKQTTRDDIAQLLEQAQRMKDFAQRLCNQIGTLNAEIGRLNRMVDEES